MKTFVLVMVVLISSSLLAGPVSFNEVDKKIVDHTFNGEWPLADSMLQAELQKMPDHPKYHYMLAWAQFYSRFFTPGSFTRDSSIKMVKENALKAILAAEEMEKTAEIKFYLGSAYGLLSRAYVMNGELWNAYWAAWDTDTYLEEVVEEYPDFGDAWIGLSVKEYFPDAVMTGFYGGLVWVFGMGGDRELGIEYAKKAFDNGSLFKPEAAIVNASYLRFFENQPTEALVYLTYLRDQYPANQFVAGQYNIAYFVSLVDEKGVAFLETEFDSLSTQYNVTNPNILNILGYTYINQGRLDDALLVLKVNLKLFPEIANCYDSLAECYYERGEYEESIKYYTMAWNKLDEDQTINDAFRDRLREGIRDKLDEMGGKIPS